MFCGLRIDEGKALALEIADALDAGILARDDQSAVDGRVIENGLSNDPETYRKFDLRTAKAQRSNCLCYIPNQLSRITCAIATVSEWVIVT